MAMESMVIGMYVRRFLTRALHEWRSHITRQKVCVLFVRSLPLSRH